MAKCLKCRICGIEDIDKDIMQLDVDYVQHGRWYAHRSCYDLNERKKLKIDIHDNQNDTFWQDAARDYFGEAMEKKFYINEQIEYQKQGIQKSCLEGLWRTRVRDEVVIKEYRRRAVRARSRHGGGSRARRGCRRGAAPCRRSLRASGAQGHGRRPRLVAPRNRPCKGNGL